MSTAFKEHQEINQNTIAEQPESALKLQRNAYFADPAPDYEQRKADLLTLKRMTGENSDALLHPGQHDLPFGGVGASGMGHYHGYEGFAPFSKLRPVFYQAGFSALKFLARPYGKFADKTLRITLKKKLQLNNIYE